MDHAAQLVDLVDKDGTLVTTKPRKEIQKEIDLYHTVFTIIKTPDNKIVLSKIPYREDLPNLYAGLLGPTVSTIRRHGETDSLAAIRALKNELYIEDFSLNKLDEYYQVLPDGHKKYMSIYTGMHSLPRDFSHVDIHSLRTFSKEELVEALNADQEEFAMTFLAIWKTHEKDLF